MGWVNDTPMAKAPEHPPYEASDRPRESDDEHEGDSERSEDIELTRAQLQDKMRFLQEGLRRFRHRNAAKEEEAKGE